MTKATIQRFIEEIEAKLAELRAAVEQFPEEPGTTPTSPLGDQGREDSDVGPSYMPFIDKVALRSLVAKAFSDMGIHGEPIGAKKVQEMIAVCGVQAEENVWSRGIIEMREE